MSRVQFFVIGSAVIFVLERALPALISWPLFLFPVFAVLFLLTSKSDAADLPYVAAASIFFDFFSGRQFGFFTLTLMTICLSIYLFKGRINTNAESFFSLFFYSLIFVFGFLLLLSFQLSFQPWPFIISWPPILTETTAISLIILYYPNVSRKI